MQDAVLDDAERGADRGAGDDHRDQRDAARLPVAKRYVSGTIRKQDELLAVDQARARIDGKRRRDERQRRRRRAAARRTSAPRRARGGRTAAITQQSDRNRQQDLRGRDRELQGRGQCPRAPANPACSNRSERSGLRCIERDGIGHGCRHFYRGLEDLFGTNRVQTAEVARLAHALIAGAAGQAVHRERDRGRSRRSPRLPTSPAASDRTAPRSGRRSCPATCAGPVSQPMIAPPARRARESRRASSFESRAHGRRSGWAAASARRRPRGRRCPRRVPRSRRSACARPLEQWPRSFPQNAREASGGTRSARRRGQSPGDDRSPMPA